jgi:uncharacterized protein (TIGR00251 family)
MGTIAAIAGGIGGLCAVLGIITAAEIIEPLGDQFTWMFWFVLSAILLLASIAFAVGRGGGYE